MDNALISVIPFSWRSFICRGLMDESSANSMEMVTGFVYLKTHFKNQAIWSALFFYILLQDN